MAATIEERRASARKASKKYYKDNKEQALARNRLYLLKRTV